MNSPSGATRLTVRMFPGYAGTVLWFRDPVDYGRAHLTIALVHDVNRWEQSYYDALIPEPAWKSADLARRYTAEGNRLAQRVADELGDRYEIEFASYEENVPTRWFRGEGPALNLRASEAFDALAVSLQAEDDEMKRALAADRRGESHGWYAYSPLSTSVFKSPREGDQ